MDERLFNNNTIEPEKEQYNDNFSVSQNTQEIDLGSKAEESFFAPEYKAPAPKYSYEAYKAQFDTAQHTTPKKTKKKSGSGRKAALVACSLALALCVGFGGGLAGAYIMKDSGSSDKPVAVTADENTKVVTAKENNDSEINVIEASKSTKGVTTVQQVVKNVKDSVVEITTESTSYSSFYGQYVVTGAGSGVIISSDGYIITNNHVIEDASNVKVTLTDGKSYDAKVIGTDETLDIALLKIEAEDLTVAVLGSSSDLEVGEMAIVIGNPLGQLGGTVTTGIISSQNRNIKIDGKNMELLQTDAAINPGNSGGGLFDAEGNLVGIVVAKSISTSSGQTVEGIGYAIPIDNVKKIINDLKTKGHVTKAYLGVSTVEVKSEKEKQYYGVENEGVYVYSVYKGQAAEKADIRVGDLIKKFDGKDVESTDALSKMVTEKEPGDKVDVVIFRDGEEITLEVTLGEYTSNSENGNSNNFHINGNNGSGNSGRGNYNDFDIDDIFRYYFN